MAARDARDHAMITIRGCHFPAHLTYDVANHMWYEPLDGGLIRCGMTVVAVALADWRIFAFTPKRVGREVEQGHACATIESSKWVGPARIAFDGVVERVNEDLVDRPSRLVEDMYDGGWMLIARPSRHDPLAGLVQGDDIAPAYRAWMDQQDFPGCADGAR